MTLDALRTLFPHTADHVYVNHAATGPLSTPVVDAMQRFVAERHRGPIDNFAGFLPVLDETRARLGRLVGAPTERIAFAPNTSSALNVLARGLRWEPGDRIAVPRGEFPANVFPFLALREEGVEVDFIPMPDGTFSLEAVEAALTPRTRLLTVSFVQYLSGFRADVAALGRLCRAHDVLLCVDAIQGLGALRLDAPAAGVDFLACGSHKWLMGAQGLGFLYVTEALQAQLRPPTGWLHGPVDWERLDDVDLAFHDDAQRFHTGTMNNLGIAALHAALCVYFDADPAACEARVRARAGRLAEGLERLGLPRYGTADPAHASGIVTVRPDEPEALFEHLAARGVTAALRNRMLRFSPTYYNTDDEIDAVLDAVAAHERGVTA